MARLRRRRVERPLLEAVQARHPRFLAAVAADARLASAQRGDPPIGSSIDLARRTLALVWQTDAFGALVAYRLKAACQRRGVPVVPRLAHRYAMRSAGVSIGDRTHLAPGVLLPHGQVVIDGFVEIGPGARIRPFVTIGLRERDLTGPTLGARVKVGTGAKLIGPIRVGDDAVIGANAVVVHDVAPGEVVVGMPARPVTPRVKLL